MVDTTVLPEEAEMLRRLCIVSDDEALQKDFYSRLLKNAGQERASLGVIQMFIREIEGFIDSGYDSTFRGLLWNLVPRWIDVLVEDKRFAEEAKREFKNFRKQ